MMWHAATALLACARISAVHSVVFASFSAEALRDRVQDCCCRVVITVDEGRGGGTPIASGATFGYLAGRHVAAQPRRDLG